MTDICPEWLKEGAASFTSQEKEISARPVYSHITHCWMLKALSAIFVHIGTNPGSYYQPKVLINSKSRKMFLIKRSDFSNRFAAKNSCGEEGYPSSLIVVKTP